MDQAAAEPSPPRSRSSETEQPSTSTSAKRRYPPEEEFQVDDSATVLEKIAKIYAERLLCDITLSVGGNSYPAHRLILCASSDVFQVMLMSPSWTESQETTVVLQEDPQCAKVFADFLKYLYTGKIHINHYSVLPLLTLADKYNVKDLIHLCLEYMQCHLVSAAGHCQLVSWLQYTLYCGHDKVSSQCQDFVKWNFDLVANSSDFVNMETDVLIWFLQCSDLVVYHEMALFQSVAQWLDFQESRMRSQLGGGNSGDAEVDQRIASLVEDVMSHVRFPMLSPCQLAELLLSKLITRHQSFFIPKMSDAMTHHAKVERVVHPPTQQQQQADGNGSGEARPHLTPRLYTTEKWGALLAIENYPSFPTYAVRTLVFSSPASLSDSRSEPVIEWSVDLYPKGVWFKKLYMIAWQGPVELPETTLQSVRLSVSLRTNQECRFSIGVLLYGVRDNVEYVRSVVQRRFVFSGSERIVNIDHLVPYDDLNHPTTPASLASRLAAGVTGAPPSPTPSPAGQYAATSTSRSTTAKAAAASPPSSSAYLVGTRRDVFKIHVILLPTTNAS